MDTPTAMKVWLHPATGQVIEQDPMERHPAYVAEHPEQFGLSASELPREEDFPDHFDFDAIERLLATRGWVRLANYNDGELLGIVVEDLGLLSAATDRDARWSIRWLLGQDEAVIPHALDVTVARKLTRFPDREAMRAYAERGVRPLGPTP